MTLIDKLLLIPIAFCFVVMMVAAFYPTEKPKDSWWFDDED